jgi:hypothetical protein
VHVVDVDSTPSRTARAVADPSPGCIGNAFRAPSRPSWFTPWALVMLDPLAVETEDEAERRTGQARRALGEDVEDRLHVRRSSSADGAQHFGRRGLPLERLLGLVEQAHVLDRDHGLVAEGAQQARRRSSEKPARTATQVTHVPIAWPSRSIGREHRASSLLLLELRSRELGVEQRNDGSST